jgi:inhibitor of KinA
MLRTPEVSPLGDSAVLVSLGDVIDNAVYQDVTRLAQQCEQHPFPGYVELVPAYSSLTIIYNPATIDFESVRAYVLDLWQRPEEVSSIAREPVVIPVCYEGEFGPDLHDVAKYHGMTPSEVVELHTSGLYVVYMIGFTPGFPYLGGLSERLATPRRKEPRVVVPAGSVGIAGQQTGIYSFDTPGGWQIIGRTPYRMFNPDARSPTLLHPGQQVRFQAITAEQYNALSSSTM